MSLRHWSRRPSWQRSPDWIPRIGGLARRSSSQQLRSSLLSAKPLCISAEEDSFAPGRLEDVLQRDWGPFRTNWVRGIIQGKPWYVFSTVLVTPESSSSSSFSASTSVDAGIAPIANDVDENENEDDDEDDWR